LHFITLIPFSTISDEILQDQINCLATIISERLQRKQSFNIAPGDYEQLMQLYEDDGDDVDFYFSSGEKLEQGNEASDDDWHDCDDNKNTSTDSDTWLLPTPNNSPTLTDERSHPVDPDTLIEVLREVANDMNQFNLLHPQAPRRSQRTIARPSSYNYNRTNKRARGRSE